MIEGRRADRVRIYGAMSTDVRPHRLRAQAPERFGNEALGNLAEAFRASFPKRQRQFQTKSGIIFAACPRQTRRVEVVALLGEERAIAEVAQELGFAESSTFGAFCWQGAGLQSGQIPGMRVSVAASGKVHVGGPHTAADVVGVQTS